MKDRFGRSDYRFLAICVAILAATVWYSVLNFHRAFPEASIDFRVSRAEGESIADAFLHTDTATYRRAASFTYDDDAKTFLERETGLGHANLLMGTRVRLWRWSYRWFRPLQKEEYRVDVTPRGEVVGYLHELAEDAPRPAASTGQARAAAEAFLRRMKRDPAALEFVQSSEIARPHRIDRTFTWKEPGFVVKDADYRVEVTVRGDEPGGYREYLKVPEQWTRDYQRMRSKNEAAANVDFALMAGLVVGLLVVLVIRLRGHDILWRRAAIVGVVGMALSFLAHLNGMPLAEFNYATTDSYASFILRELLEGALSALAAGGFLFVLTAGAEPLYREMLPRHLAVGRILTLRGLRTRRFFLGAVLGLALTGAAVAYQTAFYIGATKLGAWSPADVPYDDLLNTRFPWAFVLFGGFFPAVSEEFLFRLFAIPFLRKLFRSLVLAVVVAGFVWGFGHANYPQQPFYIRGLEVGVDGVIAGFLMLRFGILPLVIEHYSIDAVYSAMLLLRSPNLYLKLSGAASAGIVLIPIAVALVAYWRNGGFEPEAGLLNADEDPRAEHPPDAVVEAPPPSEFKYDPLGRRARIAAALLLVAGVGAALVPLDRFGERPKYKLTADQAVGASDAFLRRQGVDPAAYQHVAVPMANWDGGDARAGKYFLERLSVPAASSEFERYRPVQNWRVRYYRPLDQEEFGVAAHPETGAILGYRHTYPEDLPGADLPEPATRQLAATSAAAFGWDTSAMDLKENASDKKKARRDYKFVWEARPGDTRNVGEARYRVEIGVAGDRPSAAGAYWKLPEDYIRERNRQNAVSIATAVGRIAVLATLIVAWALLVVGFVRTGAVPWRFVLMLAGAVAAVAAAAEIVGFPLLLAEYPTSIPIETYRMTSAVGVVTSALLTFLVGAASLALVTGAFPDVRRALSPLGRRLLARDAAVAVAAGAGMTLLARQIAAALMAHFHAQAVFAVSAPSAIATALPTLSAVGDALPTVLSTAGILATVALLLRRRTWLVWLVLAMLPFIAFPGGIHTPGEFALRYATATLSTVAVGLAFCRWFARRNYLAYAVGLWVMAVANDLGEFYGNGAPVHFWVLLTILLAGLAWALLPLRTTTHG